MSSHLLISTLAYPQQQAQLIGQNNRKYAEKPNALKKVALDDIDDDLQTNQISDGPFSWSNMLGELSGVQLSGDIFKSNCELSIVKEWSCKCSSTAKEVKFKMFHQNPTTSTIA